MLLIIYDNLKFAKELRFYEMTLLFPDLNPTLF